MVFSGHNTNMSLLSNDKNSIPYHPRPDPRYKEPVSSAALDAIFDGCADFQSRKIHPGLFSDAFLTLVWIDGMVDGSAAAEEIIRPLTELIRSGTDPSPERLMYGAVYSAQAVLRESLDELVGDIALGSCAVVFDDRACAVSFDIKTRNQRSISEPMIEKSIKGGKDCFVELLRTNTSLVRRRIADPALKLKNTVIGRKSLTRAAVMYVDGVADPALINELMRRLDTIDIDGALSTGVIESYIVDKPKSLFPQLLHTERPDRLAQQLLAGRAALFVDGLPMAFIVPASLPEYLRVPQDTSQNYLVSSVLSVIRWIAVILALALPAFYVAVAMYHQEMVPTKLLMSIIASKQDVPFSTAVEILSMLLAFELLQEAGLRLPNPISDTVSIIGALIVGQSAVAAKVISPVAVIVVATAGIAGYAQPSQDLSAALRLCRFALVIAAILAGLFGVTAALCLLVWYLCTIESYGVNYTSPVSSGRRGSIAAALFRKPLRDDILRDPDLNTPDKRRQKD